MPFNSFHFVWTRIWTYLGFEEEHEIENAIETFQLNQISREEKYNPSNTLTMEED